jgi:hypothetical protein
MVTPCAVLPSVFTLYSRELGSHSEMLPDGGDAVELVMRPPGILVEILVWLLQW